MALSQFFTTLDQTIYGSEPVLFKQLLINTTFPMQCHCIIIAIYNFQTLLQFNPALPGFHLL